jgi:hypothetical protein
MTGEDVLGQWLQRIDLDQSPVPHGTGWLNRIGRDIGTRPPYRQRIRDVCGLCNSGWMSRLETTAQRVLTSFILGNAGTIEGSDLAAIAAWVQKTCLTAMYISTAEDRAAGYGLPPSEYHQLYEIRETQHPLPRSQFWMGRFNGTMPWSVEVVPQIVVIDGLPEPELPQGYLMTIVLGQLVFQGIRMTTPGFDLDVGSKQNMPPIWPGAGMASWPEGEAVSDDHYHAFALGRDLQVQEEHVSLRRWTPATDLPASQLAGDMVELPTVCGKHVAYYPSILVSEAMQGRFYAFVVPCDCGTAYLINTEPDNAHMKAAGHPSDIAAQYDRLPGTQDEFTNGSVTFRCKRLP